MDFKITTYSEEETIELAQNIESEKFPNMVICLRGDLGSGKTVFTKGFAQALEVKEDVTSPTFTIIKEYTSGEMPLYHMDVYRLDGKVDDLGIEEYYNKKRDEGKHHLVAQSHVAKKLIRIIYTLETKGIDYDINFVK